MFFLGVDGGGTKTKFALIDDQLKIHSTFETTTSHIAQVGVEGVVRVLQEGLKSVLFEGGVCKEEIKYAVLGMPGYTEVKANDIQIERAVKEVFGFTNYHIVNDAEVGWAGALACQPGINIVAGTGSIAFGVDEEGRRERIGGWGEFVGDEGSAYWIAKKTLEVYSKQKDGRLPKTVLVDIIDEKYGIKDKFEIIDIMHNRFKLKRDKIAELSLYTFEAAQKGCRYSAEIFEKAAYELFLHVEGLMKKMRFSKPILVSYVGGVFKAEELILQPLRTFLGQLGDEILLIPPRMEPCFGAAYYAYLRYKNLRAEESLTEKLLKEIAKYSEKN
ncbi:MAG: hypothetical protein PWQ34_70 [Caldanaerobacter sp.]|uniref:N-acetylglucosamine kinase n=1 Tax=Caldanaerobacter sp. TaxID=2930036 RepID=UPI0024AA874F|nr:BadF/BadG/BcrA/BcrD ATPase family protein [Caldanaerobacter sp.]MDI3517923.1 hypothetical protein [Caldanaerobacter sp.]